MSEKPPTRQVTIPEPLQLQLTDFRRRLWRMKIAESLSAGLIGLLVSFLLVYGLDRITATPGWARLLILFAGMSLFAVFAPYWIHRWVWRRRKETQIAQLIARHYPGLGDRLLGVIELQDQEANLDTLSPRLREAAMQAVAAEAREKPLVKALPAPRHLQWAGLALILTLAAALVLISTPQAAINALQRWLMPLSDTERYTFTKLENPPRELAVPFGESFQLQLQLASDSRQEPPIAIGRYADQPEIHAGIQDRSYRFSFPGQQREGSIVFRIGDLRHEVAVRPMERPAVKDVWATLTTPDYLKIPPRRINLRSGSLSAVEGSRMQIDLRMNRPLAGTSSYGPILGGPPEGSAPNPTPAATASPLRISGDAASTDTIAIGKHDLEIPFRWQDTYGLSGDAGFRIRIDAIADAAPNCYLQGVNRQHIMLPEETIDFDALAEDDFSIHALGIEWSGQLSQAGPGAPAKGELALGEGKPEDTRMLRPVAFCPAAFGISPQTLTVRAWTQDLFPGRGRVHSEPIVIYVLTRDEHRQILKNRFERQISELEDLARRELNLFEENQRLERLDGEQLQSEDGRKQLSKQQEEEDETERRSAELATDMEQLLKDAARNGEIDKDTMRKITESLKSMQELSSQDVPQVQQQLAEANQASNSAEKSEQDLDKAVEAQRKVVEKMQDAIAKANDANRRFEAGTFVKRLKKAASEQTGITQSLVESFTRSPEASILGQFQHKVDPSDLTLLGRNRSQQTATSGDIRWIQEDLANYHARTGMEGCKKILEEMRKSDITLHLEEIINALSTNLSYQAARQSKHWADELNKWASMLDAENQAANGGGAGDGGGSASESEDFEFMLRVMKMIQTQQDLRSRTRALEQFRRDHKPAGQP